MTKETESLFKILEQKNSYLVEFHKINTKEIELLTKGSLDNLENFYYSRELLLNAIERIDKRISDKRMLSDSSITKTERKKLEEILKSKKNMVLSILNQDLAIFSLVEKNEKSQKKAS